MLKKIILFYDLKQSVERTTLKFALLQHCQRVNRNIADRVLLLFFYIQIKILNNRATIGDFFYILFTNVYFVIYFLVKVRKMCVKKICFEEMARNRIRNIIACNNPDITLLT